MGAKVENKISNKFDADLKLIEEWIQKSIEQSDVILKATPRIKKLNEMVNIDLKCAEYKIQKLVPDDESEENHMEAFKNKEECIKKNFQQWTQQEIRLCYQ